MNLKANILMILVVLSVKISYGQDNSYQHLEGLVSDYVKKLQTDHIDTICIYKDYYIGYVYSTNDDDDACKCRTYIPTYILWQKYGETYLTKKDNCFDYSTVQIDSIEIWSYFSKNKNRIKKEKVKLFEYFVYENHKKEKYFMLIDHSRHLDFEMIVNKESFVTKFNEYHLQKEHNGYQNINYQHNQNLKSKKIIDELERLVKNIEIDKKLIKNRR